MFLFFLAIVLFIIGLVGIIFFKSFIRTASIVPILLAVMFMVASLVTTVPTGYTGILTTFGRVEDVTLEAGLNFKTPWQKIILMDNREQKTQFNFTAFSSDLQQTQVSGSINFNINKETVMTLYKEIGTNYPEKLIDPRLLENTKSIFSKYTAEELISNREILGDEILALMREDVKDYGINIISMAIEDIDFNDTFTNAIEAKVVAAQEKLRAETQQEQTTMEAQAAAERQQINAAAAAEVAKMQADAEAYTIVTKAKAEADANKEVSSSLTKELIEYMKNQLWNGELPDTYIGGNADNTIPIITAP